MYTNKILTEKWLTILLIIPKICMTPVQQPYPPKDTQEAKNNKDEINLLPNIGPIRPKVKISAAYHLLQFSHMLNRAKLSRIEMIVGSKSSGHSSLN